MTFLGILRTKIHKVINRIILDNEKFNSKSTLKRIGRIGANFNTTGKVSYLGYLENIQIGNNVNIVGEVVLNCDNKDSRIVIGDNCHIIGPSQFLTYGGSIVFGNHCSVNPFCIIYGHGGLSVGNFVRIAAHSIIIPANHIFKNPDETITSQGLSKEGIRIEDDVWVGSGVRILDGSFIGKGSVLGCSTVINGVIEPYSIVVGIPGKKIKSRK